jgi:glycosyltransferase involved in cell wall biosynthesis
MKPLQRVALIGNHLPRRCGIATFTHDLHRAISTSRPDLETCVVAMNDPGGTYDYPAAVRFQIQDESIDGYAQAAAFLNAAPFDVVSLQHEYGIFGGEAGGHIIELLQRLTMPVVTTLHTVLPAPTPAQRDVMGRIVARSTKLVVMAEKGRELLRSVHDVSPQKIEVIPHGIPDFPFLEAHHAKTKFGFSGRTVILTFGLLSPSKGIETVIDAMPAIIRSCPNAVYVILGATHPNLVRTQGEAYRDSLTVRARELGIEDHVVFFNQFVDQATLLSFISMCDVYATPYLNEAQMTSGTLAYSFGLGKAVVSTPYWHAREQLDDGRGILVPFSNWRRDRCAADQRCAPARDAQTRVRGQPIHDVGASGQALPGGVRFGARDEPDQQADSRRARRGLGQRQCAAARADRTFPVDVRQHGIASARRLLRARSRPRLLCRRQCAGPVVVEHPRELWRGPTAGAADCALRGLRSARMERRHAPVPQLHEL